MKTETAYPPTPELDKMKEVKATSQAIGEFLEWLQSEREFVLAEYGGSFKDTLYASHLSTEKLLAEYFKIDLKKVENERRAVLDWHRENAN